MVTDAELLHRYATEKSEAAFAELVVRHIHAVYAAALRQLNGNAALADEVTQTVFTSLARKAGVLGAGTVLAGWLYNATYYTVANVRRSEQRRVRREQEAFTMAETEANPEPELHWDELRPIIDAALWTLSRSDREAVVLRYFEDRTYKQMADTLGATEDAARMRVERALKKLREALARRQIVSTTTALGAALAARPGIAAPASLIRTVTQNAMSITAGSGIPTAGLLHLMTTTKAALIAASGIAALALATAVYERADAKAAAESLATAEQEYRTTLLRARATAAQLPAAESESRGTSVARTSPRPTAAGTAMQSTGSGAQPEQPGRVDPKEAGVEFMRRHPEVRQALIESSDASKHTEYRELYQQLGLTPEQIRQFEAILRPGGDFGRTLALGTVSLSLGSRPSAVELHRELTTVLGEEGFQTYMAYDHTMQARKLAANLASVSVETDSPLTTTQARQVIGIFSAVTKRQSFGFEWDKALAEARLVLNSAQMQMLENLRTRSEGWQKVLDATH